MTHNTAQSVGQTSVGLAEPTPSATAFIIIQVRGHAAPATNVSSGKEVHRRDPSTIVATAVERAQ